jgi:outer membrane protein TolC
MHPRNLRRTVAAAALLALAAPLSVRAAADGPPAPPPPTAQGPPATLPPAAAPPSPPPVCRLTLEEAKQRALANNKALALARLNTEEKGYGVSAAQKDYFPKLLGNVSYFRFSDDLGTVLTASGRHGFLAPGSSIAQLAVLNQNSTLSTVLVAQPITKLIAVNAAVQLARADEAIAHAQADKGTREVLSGVEQAYQGLLGAQRIQTALELQVKLLEQLLAAEPLPELRVGLVEARQGLVQTRAQIQQLTDLLDNLLDLPPCTVLELVDPLPAPPPVRCADEAAQMALGNNPDVREAEQGVAKAEAALKVARMNYLPDVNVVAGYANQNFADYIQPNFSYVGVTGSWTLFEWGKRKEVSRQRQTLIALANQNLQVITDKVQLDARKAYVAFEQAREEYRLAGEMVQARKEAEKAAAGAAVVKAKSETAKAELETMKAEIAYRVAHAQLAALLGCP